MRVCKDPVDYLQESIVAAFEHCPTLLTGLVSGRAQGQAHYSGILQLRPGENEKGWKIFTAGIRSDW